MPRFTVLGIALLGLALALPSPLPVAAAAVEATSSADANVVRETQISPTPTSLATRTWEPTVATHPTDPATIAVIYPRGDNPVYAILRISHDGGKTWKTSAQAPFRGGYHPVIAWGPGPHPSSARLYYATLTGAHNAAYLATSHSDNEGATWSSPRVERSTTPWVGGFPDITTDNNPASPNYGLVYVAYNWPASNTRGPGLHVLASADFGRTFKATEIAVATRPAGYSDTWRIDYRLRTAPDGAVYVSFYQLDLHYWNPDNIFAKGGYSNVGRIGFSVARFEFNRASKTFTHHPSVSVAQLPENAWNMGYFPAGTDGGLRTDPQWSTGLDVDSITGRVYLAVGVSGGVRVYRSDDQGKTWRHKTLPAAPDVNGRRQWSAKPNLVVGDGFVMVTLHTLDRGSSGATVGNAYAISYDGGNTWHRPQAINGIRWRDTNLNDAIVINGSGLRDRAALTADRRHVFFAYGDGRLATGDKAGQSAIFGSLIAVEVPVAAP